MFYKKIFIVIIFLLASDLVFAQSWVGSNSNNPATSSGVSRSVGVSILSEKDYERLCGGKDSLASELESTREKETRKRTEMIKTTVAAVGLEKNNLLAANCFAQIKMLWSTIESLVTSPTRSKALNLVLGVLLEKMACATFNTISNNFGLTPILTNASKYVTFVSDVSEGKGQYNANLPYGLGRYFDLGVGFVPEEPAPKPLPVPAPETSVIP